MEDSAKQGAQQVRQVTRLRLQGRAEGSKVRSDRDVGSSSGVLSGGG